MKATASALWMPTEQDQRLSEVVDRERTRLRAFIRRRVADAGDAEDIVQEVFYELVLAYRLMTPIEHVTAWLFRVARNRITDLFRRNGPRALKEGRAAAEGEDATPGLTELAAPRETGPDAAYARAVLLAELQAALDELPEEQREVFVAHELEGRSFRQLAAETGVSVNTLLSRKHYAVLHLRRRLRSIHDEFAGS
jgi:RNA polymerase sigma factor (sigma-70 family)